MTLRGNFEVADSERFAGWAWDTEKPTEAVPLLVLVDDKEVGWISAKLYRKDLQMAGIGTGAHAFVVRTRSVDILPGSRIVAVRHRITGEDIPNSPRSLNLLQPMRPKQMEKGLKPYIEGGNNSLYTDENLCLDEPLKLDDCVIQGHLEYATRSKVSGWAWDLNNPDHSLMLRILVDGEPVARVKADLNRPDLEIAGIGNGCHAFELNWSSISLPVESFNVHVQVEGTDEDIPNSPAQVP